MTEMAGGPEDLATENARLKSELRELQAKREEEILALENRAASERLSFKSNTESLRQRADELESMKGKMVKLTRQLDEEVVRRDLMQAESSALERKVYDLSKSAGTSSPMSSTRRVQDRLGEEDEQQLRERGAQVSLKLMRVVDQWMRTKDLQQVMLRNASVNDAAFGTLVQALLDCPSLQTIDLSQNLLTMDSCSDICVLITTAPSLSFVSLAENKLSLRSIGYFMTAVMERQNTKKLMPLDILDLQGNEGLLAAANAHCPDSLLQQVQPFLSSTSNLPKKATQVVAQVMRALWHFMHETQHPQVGHANPDQVDFHTLDKATTRRMENALMKIMLLSESEAGGQRAVTANFALSSLQAPPMDYESTPREGSAGDVGTGGLGSTSGKGGQGKEDEMNRSNRLAGTGKLGGSGKIGGKPGGTRKHPRGAGHGARSPTGSRSPGGRAAGSRSPGGRAAGSRSPGGRRKPGEQQELEVARPDRKHVIVDPFADLKTAFEPPKDKLKTFNLKQIVTRNGTVLMNMLERLLEVTEIDAYDLETDQTLLEFACNTGNKGLAKLCYRRGANLSARTRKGGTAFNIVTRHRQYEMMEFLHTYGVKVNSCDAEGMTALHVAAGNNDVDAVCRLLEWGADVNARDNKRRTPLHIAARSGNTKVTMLLLEVGADMNAKDEREYTAVAHAEAKNHFQLMDRLVQLGGRGHGLQAKSKDLDRSRSAKQIGELVVSASMLKSSSLGRIGKVAVKGMSGPLSPSALTALGK